MRQRYGRGCPSWYKDGQTYTSSRLVNAVANILCETTTRETSVFAERLQLDMRHLTYAIELETGMTLKSLINEYRLAKVQKQDESDNNK